MSSRLAQRAIVVTLIVAAIGGALAVRLVSNHQLDTARSNRIDTAQDRLDEAIRGRAFYLEDVADVVGVHDDADLTEFSRYAHVRGRNETSVVAVQWLRRSPTGELVPPKDTGPDPILVAPANPGDRELAHASSERTAKPAVQVASLGKDANVSEPVRLANGHQGFYLAVPVEAHDFSGDVSGVESQSAIVGLIDAQAFAAEGLSDMPGFRLNDGETTLASAGSGLDEPVSAGVTVPGQDWTVSVAGGSVTPIEKMLPWLLVAFGMGLSLTVSLVLGSAAKRRDAALELADARSSELADSLRRVERANHELEHARSEAERRSREDALLGIFNRRHFVEVLAAELARAERGGPAPAILLLDLDHFKRVNDRHGHLTGDAVLQAAAKRIQSTLRESDVLARWGGEEFAVLAPGIDRESAIALAERARKAMAETTVDAGGVPMTLTLSVGAALASDGLDSPDAMVGAADQALYDAKHAGRNCVRVWDPEGSAEPAKSPA